MIDKYVTNSSGFYKGKLLGVDLAKHFLQHDNFFFIKLFQDDPVHTGDDSPDRKFKISGNIRQFNMDISPVCAVDRAVDQAFGLHPLQYAGDRRVLHAQVRGNIFRIMHIEFPDTAQNTVLDRRDIKTRQILFHVLENCVLCPGQEVIDAIVQTVQIVQIAHNNVPPHEP